MTESKGILTNPFSGKGSTQNIPGTLQISRGSRSSPQMELFA